MVVLKVPVGQLSCHIARCIVKIVNIGGTGAKAGGYVVDAVFVFKDLDFFIGILSYKLSIAYFIFRDTKDSRGRLRQLGQE